MCRFPTHILGNTLDLILTNSPHKVGDVSVTKTFPSDHYAINFNIYFRNSNFTGFTSPTTFLNYSKADYQGMCDYLLDWDFSECFESNNVQEIWSLIKSAIHAAISQFVPVSRTSRRQGHLPKWFDSSLRYDLKRLRTLRRKCSTRPTSHLASKLQCLEVQFQTAVSLAKSNYLSNIVSSNNSSKIYSHIRSTTKSHSIPPQVTLDNMSASTDTDKADLFNRYFYSVYSHKKMTVAPHVSLSATIDTIDITAADVGNVMSK